MTQSPTRMTPSVIMTSHSLFDFVTLVVREHVFHNSGCNNLLFVFCVWFIFCGHKSNTNDKYYRQISLNLSISLAGHWVFLANCHLSLSWMCELDKLVDELQIQESHPDFRLWLSSSPHPEFPIAILQTGIKITTEPPRVRHMLNAQLSYFCSLVCCNERCLLFVFDCVSL